MSDQLEDVRQSQVRVGGQRLQRLERVGQADEALERRRRVQRQAVDELLFAVEQQDSVVRTQRLHAGPDRRRFDHQARVVQVVDLVPSFPRQCSNSKTQKKKEQQQKNSAMYSMDIRILTN